MTAGLYLLVLVSALAAAITGAPHQKLSDPERKGAGDALYGGETALLQLQASVATGKGKTKRAAINDFNSRWAKGVIPYEFDKSKPVSNKAKQLVKEATAHITKKTKGCIKFVERTNEKNFVNIRDEKDGCHSIVGFANSGPQTLSLGSKCDYFGTVVHELMHAVGFEHEHQRPDRDQYITINFANVKPKSKPDFDIIRDGKVFNGFNFDSIMMYGPTAFSTNDKPTMAAKDGRQWTSPYDKDTMADSDAEEIIKFYGDHCNARN